MTEDILAGPAAGVLPDGSIRPGEDADGPAIAAVIATVFSAYPHCFYVPEEMPELAAVARHYRGRDGAVWVAEAAGRVVGSLAVARTADPETFELAKVYLLPAVRGRGLAGRMLAEAEGLARARGGRRLRLWSDTKFVEGHAFYARSGFRRLPVVRFLADRSLTREFAFDKSLAPAPAPGAGRAGA